MQVSVLKQYDCMNMEYIEIFIAKRRKEGAKYF